MIFVDCGTNFGTKGNLKLHEQAVHQNITPHNCDSCEKSFGQKKYLSQRKT